MASFYLNMHFWNTPHSDVLVTFSPVSVAHGCSYWTLRFYAILFKHLENVWRIPFHFILSPKGHLELQSFTPSLKPASESRSHHSFIARLRLCFETLGYLFSVTFTSYGWVLRRLRRELCATIYWFGAHSANKELLCPSDNFVFGKMTWFFPPMAMLVRRNDSFWRMFTSACGCRWEEWVHRKDSALGIPMASISSPLSAA